MMDEQEVINAILESSISVVEACEKAGINCDAFRDKTIILTDLLGEETDNWSGERVQKAKEDVKSECFAMIAILREKLIEEILGD